MSKQQEEISKQQLVDACGQRGVGSKIGLNRVPNFAEYRVFEAVFAEYRYRVFDKV